MKLPSTALPPWSPAPHRIEHTFKKKQSIVVRGTVSHIHKVKQNTASISPSMCFSASAGINGPDVNGLVLLVETFTVLFDHFFLILFLQREAKCKCDNTDNSENATKVCQELTSRAPTTGVHNLSGFEGSLSLWVSDGRWPLSRSYGYELVTKKKLRIHFSNYFPYHPFRHTYVPIRAVRVPWSVTTSALSSFHGLSDEFFADPYLTKSPISFRVALQPCNKYLHTFNCTLEIIETKSKTNEIRPTCFTIAYCSSVRNVSEPSWNAYPRMSASTRSLFESIHLIWIDPQAS
jgi:hypothetical protein